MIVKFDKQLMENIHVDFLRFLDQLENKKMYEDNPELCKMAYMWFAMGHANSLDSTSVFNMNFNNDKSNNNIH